MDWRIYYGDGSTFDSDMGAPADAPPVGVICICQRDLTPPHQPEVVKGDNYYYWSPAMQWQGSCRDGVIDRSLEREPTEALKQGRRLSRVDYAAIMNAAYADPDFQ